jgi:hypothetical protein
VILVTRSFAFVESQFGAVFGLSIDLALLVSLGLMMKGERGRDVPSLLGPVPVGSAAATGDSASRVA